MVASLVGGEGLVLAPQIEEKIK